MKINKILLTEKDVLIFLKNHVNEQLDRVELDEGGELYYDDSYLLSRAGDLLTELIKEYSSLKSTASTASTAQHAQEPAMYMHIATGSVDTYDDWNYEQDGVDVNAVDLGEVVEVVRDSNGDWIAK
jgi:hypothetical protein